ncbi:MAG: OprO/OprP family phosphate-selective porin [Luteimonas sp.]
MPLLRPSPLFAALLALGATAPAMAADQVTLEQLSQRLQALEQRLGTTPAVAGGDLDAASLDQRLRVIERKLELQAEEAANKAKSTPVVSLTPSKGLAVKSPDGDSEIRFRGLVQGDGRFFLDSDGPSDTFLLRRVEPTIEGNWGIFGFRITGQFAGDTATLQDAYADLKFDPRATVRVGKTKTPFGLERLQSSASTEEVELGLPSELAPGRDIGVQLQGELAEATVTYALGVYNGTVDGRDAVTSNPDDDFEIAARLFFEPWKNSGNGLSGLGFGIAGTHGDTHGAGSNYLPRYRTPGQVQFFGYRDDVLADGERMRWSPQAYFYHGPLGLLGEYIVSRQHLLSTTSGIDASIDNHAWQLSAGWVLSGEDNTYKGVVKPNHPFAIGESGWGAFELVGRYGRLDIDDAAFPLFADPESAARSASSWGLGLNWYLTSNLKLMANYTHTVFDGGDGDGGDRPDETTLFTRAQLSF